MNFSRRHFLKSTLGASSLLFAENLFLRAAAEELKLDYGPPRSFSFDALKQRAEDMAGEIYLSPPKPAPDIVHAIDYDAHGKIRFKTELAPFADKAGAHPVTFFHPGRFFPKKVTIHVVDGGKAREILYSPDYFDMPADSPAHKLGQDSGFAGFRFQESQSRPDWRTQDWIVFLGAAYFRAIGELNQYGLSARGIAVNVAVAQKKEEFPDFREFWIETPEENSATDVVYALLDGPSLAGAYKFTLTRGTGVVAEVEKYLYLRKKVDQLGIAPMSAMYWFSETRRPMLADWRPEIHDSDGLQLWTGAGERIWRPLNDPPRTTTSSFVDDSPKGFGLMQRDRNFDHYLDGVYYDRRPSLWIEPAGRWGKGSVQLVEIPTGDEYHDNIVAMWVAAEPAELGSRFSYQYKMYWQADEPNPASIARVVATRLGQGGQPGSDNRPKRSRKFVIEFMGGGLNALPAGVKPEPVISASRGTIDPFTITEAVPDGVKGHWRTQFDLNVPGEAPVDLRCFLRLGADVLSETWLYQYHPTGEG